MIASERAQNIIVVTTIVAAIVSSGFLVGNAQYYGGTYTLAGRLNVEFVGVRVSHIDHTNESINPIIRVTFNLQTTSESDGSVRLRFMESYVTLNGDALSYAAFAYTLGESEQVLYSGFNETFNMNSEITASDKDTVLAAHTASFWNWTINFDYYFIVFDERGTITWRYLEFQTLETTVV